MGLGRRQTLKGTIVCGALFVGLVGRRLACEHSCEIMKLCVQVLLICSQFARILLVIVLGLYVWAIWGCFVLVPGETPLGRILVD